VSPDPDQISSSKCRPITTTATRPAPAARGAIAADCARLQDIGATAKVAWAARVKRRGVSITESGRAQLNMLKDEAFTKRII